jgi:hypothetical protein
VVLKNWAFCNFESKALKKNCVSVATSYFRDRNNLKKKKGNETKSALSIKQIENIDHTD